MKELIDLIPFVDVIIMALSAFFLYLGWKHGLPRLLMALGSIYTGFLLASIYYHIFAVTLGTMFQWKPGFAPDLVGFIALDLVVTVVMLALLLSLFGHLEIKGRAAVFGRVGGTMVGLASAILIAGISVTLLHVPYEANKGKLEANNQMAVVQLFNEGYNKSLFAPLLVKGAPYLMSTTTPMLPPEAQVRGTVPLLESVAAQK